MGIAENHAAEKQASRRVGVIEGLCRAKATLRNTNKPFVTTQDAMDAIQHEIDRITHDAQAYAQLVEHNPAVLPFVTRSAV